MRRHHWLRRAQRGLEVGVTLVAIVVLARPLFGGQVSPAYWLVMPFFAAYLPIAWWLLLRPPRQSAADAAQDGRTYANVRLSQLRGALRELWIARAATGVLAAYAMAAAVVAFLWGSAAWQAAAGSLLLYATACLLVSWGLSRWRGRRHRREYRRLLRLTRNG